MPIFFVIFDENDPLYILVEFENDRMSPRESPKNGRIGANGLNCKISFNSQPIFEIYDENYPRKKTFMSLRHFWNFRNFWNFANFWNFKCQLRPNGYNYCQFFFVIFGENDAVYILVEFESDRMSPRESPKNGRIGAHGLNCKIFVNSEFRFEICDKNYPMKKIFMSLRQFWNFLFLTTRGILAFSRFALRSGGLIYFCSDRESFKEFKKSVFKSALRCADGFWGRKLIFL